MTLIDKEEALTAIANEIRKLHNEDAIVVGEKIEEIGLRTAFDIIKRLPSAKTERKKVKWINRKVVPIDEMSFDEWQQAQCSECGMWHTTPYKYYFENYKYCPHCGADMREYKDE